MVNYQQVKLTGKLLDWRICEGLERAFLPANRDVGVEFHITLRRSYHRSKTTRVIPRDTTQMDMVGSCFHSSDTCLLREYFFRVTSFRVTPRPGSVGTVTNPSEATSRFSLVISQRSGELL